MVILDIIIAAFLAYGVIKGMKTGLVKTLAGFIALLLGVFLALKLTVKVAAMLGTVVSSSAIVLTAIAFVVIIVATSFAVKFLAKIISKILSFTPLGFLNKIGGAFLGMLRMAFIVSAILFVFDKAGIIDPKYKSNTVLYPQVVNVAPVISSYTLGLLPQVQDVFKDVEQYFDSSLKNI